MYFAQPGNSFIWYGLILLAFGEFIRFSGVRYAGGITRTTKVGAPSLCTSGPFSYVRNPLYIGNIIMYTGVVLIAGAPNVLVMLLITWCFFTVQYGLIIALEEETLTGLFGEEYQLYKQNVRAFFPRFTPWNPSDSRVPMSYKKTFKTEKRTLQNSLFVLFLILVRTQFPAV